MSHICRNPAGANGWASGDTHSNHLFSRNSVSLKNNQPAGITEITGEAATSFDIDATTDTLDTIATWRAALLDRIARALLVFELHDCETDILPLIEEVTAFKRVCACIGWRGDT